MGKNTAIWNVEMRDALETMLKEGFRVSKIAETLSISPMSVYLEIKRGVSEEEYLNKQYTKYSAKKSVDKQLEEFKRVLLEGK